MGRILRIGALLCFALPGAFLVAQMEVARAGNTLGATTGPGVGGQVHAFAFDPDDPGVAYAGGDVCGVYRYTISTGRWEPWSADLGFADLNLSFYVDDLLVVGDHPGVPSEYQGVYAATWGGVYFRGRQSSTWDCLTDSLYYRGGYARRVFDSSGFHNTRLRIPFSSIAFDTLTHELFAGAGHARVADGHAEYKDFYPTTNGQPAGNSGQWSLWRCDLDSSRIFSPAANSDHGKVRQIAVAYFEDGSTTVSRIAYACDDGVILNEAGAVQNIWVGADKKGIDGPISEDPWGVAAGRDGIVYALTSRSDPGHAPPGLWSFDLTTDPDTTSWHAVKGDNTVWPHTTAWDEFLREPTRDLTELTVIPGSGSTPDEIFVGEGRDGADVEGGSDSFGLAGFFRYGRFSDATGPRTGWAHIHRTQSTENGQSNRIIVADWRSGAIAADSLSYDESGWHSYYPSLRALVPFAVHPTNADLMVAVDYGIPLITTNGGAQWSNLYCEGSSSAGWNGRGLNLLCATSSTFTSDGRVVLGALDYGAFIGIGASNSAYQPLHDPDHAMPPLWPKAQDVESVDYDGVHEIYMVDSATWTEWQGSVLHYEDWIWLWNEQSREWVNVSKLKEASGSLHSTVAAALNGSCAGCFSVAVMDIADIDFADPSTMFVAAAAKVLNSERPYDYDRHHVICKGTRIAGTSQWQWSVLFDLDPGNHGTAEINRLCVIPGQNALLFACKVKGYSGGTNQGGL
jgi:hypothetical protein